MSLAGLEGKRRARILYGFLFFSLLLGAPIRGAAAQSAQSDLEAELASRLQSFSQNELVTRDQHFRQSADLRADREYVLSLYNNPSLADPESLQEFFALLTPDETSMLLQADALASDIEVIREYVRQNNLEGIFGGTYVDDQGKGGIVYTGFTLDADSHFQVLLDRVPHPDKLRLFPVRQTEAEIDDLVAQVTAAIDELASSGITVRGVGTSIPENVVQIDVASADPQTVGKLENRFGASKIKVVETPVIRALIDRKNYPPPLIAGVEIWNQLGFLSRGLCTALGGYAM